MRYTLVALFAFAACGPTAQQAVLKTTLTGLNAARDGFIAWDGVHQQAIVGEAANPEDGKTKLAGYRQAREKVVIAFELGYRLLAVAALELNDLNIGAALHAAGDIYDAVRRLTGDAVAGGP